MDTEKDSKENISILEPPSQEDVKADVDNKSNILFRESEIKKEDEEDQSIFKNEFLDTRLTSSEALPSESLFGCEKCNYKSREETSLKLHKMTHLGDEPFKCDECPYTSTRSSSLKVHKMKHTGEKPYGCDVCNYKCKVSSRLRIHKMTHSGELPFSCEKCDYKSRTSVHLKSHMKVHNKSNVRA